MVVVINKHATTVRIMNMCKLRISLLTTVLHTLNIFSADPHPLIICVAPPRTMSTLLLRAIHEQGNGIAIFNEQCNYAYNRLCGYSNEKLDQLWQDSAPRTLPEVAQRLLAEVEKAPVFTKEMRAAADALFEHAPELLHYPHLHTIFLVRHPYDMMLSNYRMRKERDDNSTSTVLSISHQDLADRLSYRKLYELFTHLQATGTHTPIVIISEELCNHPEHVMAFLCRKLSIPFSADKLTWQPFPENFTGREEWHAAAQHSSMHYWHGEALQTSGFHAPKEYASQKTVDVLMNAIEDPTLRTMYGELYTDNLYFYEKFLEIFQKQIFANTMTT